MRSKPRADNGSVRIEAIRNSLGMTPTEFSIALGYRTGGGVDAAIRTESVSEMLVLAAEGLAARRGTQHRVRLLVEIAPSGDVSAIHVDGDQTIVLNGAKFLLVPLQ